MKGATVPPKESSSRLISLQAKHKALGTIASLMSRQVQIDVHPILKEVLAETVTALGAPMGCLHLLDEEEGVFTLVEEHLLDPVWARAWSRLSLKGTTPVAKVHSLKKTVELTGDETPGDLGGVVTAPVMGAEIFLGTLSLMWPRPARPHADPYRAKFLETVGCLLGLALEQAGLVSELLDNLGSLVQLKKQEEERNAQLNQLNEQMKVANQRLEELSITDGLTNLYNRRYIHERLEAEIIRSRRHRYPVCLIMADLDHFKKVNDRLGHLVGDEALKLFAEIMRKGVREVDLVGRYGGEEFVLVLFDCDLEAGRKVAEKLRTAAHKASLVEPFKPLGGFTVSMGVAQLKIEMSADDLIGAADEAMYRAKKNGRNRVETAPL
jgi:diguanylate cyclase (GGDEF)-like protein